MAYQKPIILEIKDNIIRIKNPDITNPKFKTYLTAASTAATPTTLTVADNTKALDNDLIILGNYGEEGTEIANLTATPSQGTSMALTATVFNHPKNTPVTHIEWDEIEIIGATTSGAIAAGTGTVLNTSSAEVLITPNKEYTEYHLIEPTLAEISTYTYFGARWHNSAASTPYFSGYSEEWENAEPAYNSVAKMKEEGLGLIGEEEKEGDDATDPGKLLADVNNCTRFIQSFKKKWSFELTNKASDTLATVTQTVTDPTDVKDPNTGISYERIWISGSDNLDYLSKFDYEEKTKSWVSTTLATAILTTDTTVELTDTSDFADAGAINIEGDIIDYISKSDTTNILSGVTGITSAHATTGVAVWQNISDGTPSHYTIYNGSIYLYPLPDSDVNGKVLHIDYYKTLTALDSNLDTITPSFPLAYQYYIASMVKRRQGNREEAKEWWDDFMKELQREADNDIIPSGASFRFTV